MRSLPFHEVLLRRIHGLPFADSPPGTWEFFVKCCGSAFVAGVAHRALLMHGLDLRPCLPAIRAPLLLVCGDDDPLVSRDCEQELLTGLPNADRVELNRCGHYPRFTHPEVLAVVMRRFLLPSG
jgi:pimeloyl-ACP methyl ester carboxylesterase